MVWIVGQNNFVKLIPRWESVRPVAAQEVGQGLGRESFEQAKLKFTNKLAVCFITVKKFKMRKLVSILFENFNYVNVIIKFKNNAAKFVCKLIPVQRRQFSEKDFSGWGWASQMEWSESRQSPLCWTSEPEAAQHLKLLHEYNRGRRFRSEQNFIKLIGPKYFI
jgi:hypothetical protein